MMLFKSSVLLNIQSGFSFIMESEVLRSPSSVLSLSSSPFHSGKVCFSHVEDWHWCTTIKNIFLVELIYWHYIMSSLTLVSVFWDRFYFIYYWDSSTPCYIFVTIFMEHIILFFHFQTMYVHRSKFRLLQMPCTCILVAFSPFSQSMSMY